MWGWCVYCFHRFMEYLSQCALGNKVYFWNRVPRANKFEKLWLRQFSLVQDFLELLITNIPMTLKTEIYNMIFTEYFFFMKPIFHGIHFWKVGCNG